MFHSLTYEGSIDMAAITDPDHYAAVQAQVRTSHSVERTCDAVNRKFKKVLTPMCILGE